NIPGATGATYNVTTKGNYTCVTTSACGTVESTPIFVNVIKNPNASISAGGPTTFCAGGSVILTEVAVAGCTYQWYKGASPIAGATSLTYTATTSGNYKCRVTKAATGCFKNSNAIAVSVPCREGEMINDENAFSIYPNPNNGTFIIEATATTQNFASTESTIEIYNNLGQLIFSKKIISNDGIINEAIELKNITPGIYLVKLWNNNIYNVKNIIIE
ncbi:MAG: T9SS type A sorting domain-containing protein, partial [Chitinophagales bacterium]